MGILYLRKLQNVYLMIGKKLMLFILLMPFLSCSKKVALYCTDPNYTGFCFEFHDENEFKYYEAGCLEVLEGKGHYEIVGDSLICHFEDYEIKKIGKITISKTNTNDSIIKISLTVLDAETKKPLIGANATLYELDEMKGGKSSDFKGKSELEVNYYGNEIRVDLSYINYFPLSFKLDQAGEYEIIAVMEGGFSRLMVKQDRV